MTEDTTGYARVAATLGRAGWQRDALHTATLGALQGRGTSKAKALADLGRLITEAAQRGDGQADRVSFAFDAANRQLWVAVPDVLHGGHDAYAVDVSGEVPVHGRSTSSGVAAAADAFTRCEGMTPVTADRPTARELPAMPAEVRDMLAKADDAAHAWDLDTDAMRAALADLMDYVSGQFAPSELDRSHVVTFDPRPVTGPGALDGLRRMSLQEARELQRGAFPRIGRIINADTLAEVS